MRNKKKNDKKLIINNRNFNEIIAKIKRYVRRNYNILLSVGGVLVVAIIVAVILSVVGKRKVEDIMPGKETESSYSWAEEEVPLEENADQAIHQLIQVYYDAKASGDIDTLTAICDSISEQDILTFKEFANYIDDYPTVEIYTKKGLGEGETIVYVYYKMTFINHEEEFPGYSSHYVCTAEDGSLYVKRSNFSDELNEYISYVCTEDDVVEFNNKVTAEYDTFKEEHPDVAGYPNEVTAQVNMNVGVKLSEMQAAGSKDVSDGDVPEENENVPEEPEEDAGPKFAVATTTVNVRSSDSEQADKLGKVSGGFRIEVLEQRVNGWSKVKYESKEGYIKSEFLQMEERADGLASIGTVTASTNINVRASASETASKLGVLTGGEKADLIAEEGDWSKIKYNGQVGYVKSEYVTK